MGWKNLMLAALAGGALALVGIPGEAAAQVEDLREQYLIELPPSLGPLLEQVGRGAPGSSSGSPGAFGAGWGDVFVGGGFQGRTRYAAGGNFDRDAIDGSAVVGFGLGNARELVGVEVAVTSVSTFDSGFFDKTAVSLKAHRVLPNNWGVAVGYENALTFGEGLDGGNSLYGVLTKVWDTSSWSPFLAGTTSIGIGNGRFRFEEDVTAGKETVNLFASVGVHVYEGIGIIADYTGQDVTLAASLVPFRNIPLTITPGIADVTGMAGDGARFILGFGMGMNVKQIPDTIFP